MKDRKLIAEATRLAEPYCVTKGSRFRLKDFDPGDTNGVNPRNMPKSCSNRAVAMASQMQEKLYAQDRWRCS